MFSPKEDSDESSLHEFIMRDERNPRIVYSEDIPTISGLKLAEERRWTDKVSGHTIHVQYYSTKKSTHEIVNSRYYQSLFYTSITKYVLFVKKDDEFASVKLLNQYYGTHNHRFSNII